MKAPPILHLAGAGLLLIIAGAVLFLPADTGGTAVTGTVLIDGLPLADAEVFFFSVEDKRTVQSFHGRTDQQGRYELMKPLEPGNYRVFLRASPSADVSSVLPGAGPEVDAEQLATFASAQFQRARIRRERPNRRTIELLKNPLPEVWSSPSESVLTVRVPNHRTHVADLDLRTTAVTAGRDRMPR